MKSKGIIRVVITIIMAIIIFIISCWDVCVFFFFTRFHIMEIMHLTVQLDYTSVTKRLELFKNSLNVNPNLDPFGIT